MSEIINTANPYTNMEFVDLGLSVKWASCNLGATKPEEVGDYYAWGEIETKSVIIMLFLSEQSYLMIQMLLPILKL